jgi:hypothetical protein
MTYIPFEDHAAARASGTFFREAARDAEERSGGVDIHGMLGSPRLSARLNLAEVPASSRSYVFADRHRSKASLQKAPGRRTAAATALDGAGIQ